VDGEGTVLVTETVQLDPGRNPGLTKPEIEAELARTIGSKHVVWVPRGLTRDSERFGTRGHVDIVAAIPSPGTLLVHSQQDPAHPDFEVSREIISFLSATRDAAGREWNIIEVPAPTALTDAEGFVDYSYINHVVVNGGVIACTFSDPNDEKALRILADAYPGRRVVGIDARELFARGGGIHCITQQQPAASWKGQS
jgi:agmatine deiminase